jgi:aminoglycoside phosphotransferase (APT) family kinase protein
VFEQSDIAHYLLSLGVVKPSAILDEGFAVVDVSRRNRVFLATTRSGPAFVVKQALPAAAPGLAHEAAVLRLLAGVPELAAHVPEVVHEEPGGACVVLRTPAGARDWTDGRGRAGVLRARALGRAIASLHRFDSDALEAPEPMWGLGLSEPPHAMVLQLSAAAQDVVARIQASRYVCDRLDELRAAGAARAFVHGDLRWDNCLVVRASGARRGTRVLIVDWECAGLADPACDVGSVLAEYLRDWVASIPIVEPVDPGRLVAHARRPLAAARPSMQAFWAAYRGFDRAPSLRRVVELTAVRLLEAAIEVAQGLATATAHVVTLLQVADNLLRRPEVAGSRLLGLRE